MTDIIYDSKLNQISWSVPVPSQGDILRYFVVGENVGNQDQLNFSVQDTIIGSELLEIMFNNSGTWSIMVCKLYMRVFTMSKSLKLVLMKVCIYYTNHQKILFSIHKNKWHKLTTLQA